MSNSAAADNDDVYAGIWMSNADADDHGNFATNNNSSSAKPTSATIVTVVKKSGKTAEECAGGSADSMRTVFSNSTNALGSVYRMTLVA